MPIILDRRLKGLGEKAFAPLRRIGKFEKFEAAVAPKYAAAVEEYTNEVIGTVEKRSRLKRRTGRLIQSLYAGVRVTGRTHFDTIKVVVNGTPPAVAHEFGATVRPKRTTYLAIPVLFGLKADGSPKFLRPQSWARFKPFVFTSKDGRKFLAYRTKDGQLRVIYRLIDEIRIPKRLGLNDAFNKGINKLLRRFGQLATSYLAQTNWFEEMKKGAQRGTRTAVKGIGVTSRTTRR